MENKKVPYEVIQEIEFLAGKAARILANIQSFIIKHKTEEGHISELHNAAIDARNSVYKIDTLQDAEDVCRRLDDIENKFKQLSSER